MSDPSPQLFYRLLPNGAGWYWEIIDSENGIVERGIANERRRARAAAFEAAFDLRKTIPEAYRVGAGNPRDVPIFL
jgi:hypothetical protein